jgi:hypothetical protein
VISTPPALEPCRKTVNPASACSVFNSKHRMRNILAGLLVIATLERRIQPCESMKSAAPAAPAPGTARPVPALSNDLWLQRNNSTIQDTFVGISSKPHRGWTGGRRVQAVQQQPPSCLHLPPLFHCNWRAGPTGCTCDHDDRYCGARLCSASNPSEQDANFMARKLGQLQPFIVLFPQECVGHARSLHFWARVNTVLAGQRRPTGSVPVGKAA